MTSYEFKVGPNAEIDVHVQSGRVEINQGTSGKIKVEVDTDDPGFVVEQRGDLIFISFDHDSGWLSRRSAYVVAEVPEGTDVTVGTATAKIECNANVGRCEAKTASGDVEINSAESAVLKTASGDAAIGTVTGDIKIKSASGDAHIRKSDGKVSCSSASGDIHITAGNGPVSVATASGDLVISHFRGRKASFKSMSGSASIGVPAGTRLDLDATLLSGKLNLPKPSGDTPSSDRQMTIRAKLVSGDLSIQRVEA